MAKRRKQVSEEERIAGNLNHELQDLRRSWVNEPTILWKLGQRVKHGHIDKSIVVEVLDDGKILKLEEWDTVKPGSQNAGQKDHRFMYMAWHEVHMYQTHEDIKSTDSFRKNEDVFVTYSNRCVSGLLTMYYHFGLDLEPDYQRGNVWELKDKVSLIDSMFNNVDIGKFVVIHLPISEDKKLYEMVDGKQRTLALVDFIERKFKYRGKTFDELHPRDRGHITDYAIPIGELSGTNRSEELSSKQKYEQFLKLNTGGKPVDPEHIARVQSLYNKECANQEKS